MLPNHLSVNNWASIILGLLLLNSYALHSQSWQWSNQIGSNQWDVSGYIVTDSNGSSYSAGTFKGAFCYFPGDTSNVVNGSCDFYIAKFNSSGVLQWWQQLGGPMSTCNEGIGSILSDQDDNIYLAGGYGGPASFGSIILPNSGTQDGYIAKFDDSGNCLWANSISSNAADGVSGVTVDDIGNIYVCGTNNNTANVSGFIIPPGGFIAKYDTSGNCIWAKHKISSTLLFGTNYCAATPSSIKFTNGFISISGFMGDDTVTFDTSTVYSKFQYNYLARFDTSGTLKWVRTFGGPQIDGVNFEHSVDDFGNNYITGTCYGQGYFQTDTLTGSVWQAFIVKLDSLGNEQWVRNISSSIGSWGNMVSSDGDGNVYVTGKFRGNTTFGNFNVTAGSSNDMFIARYNSTGDCLGVRFFGEAEGFGVTQDNNGNAYVCGTFDNTVTIGGNTYTTYGDKDIFIAKLDEIVGIEEINGRTGNQLLIYANPNAGKCNITVPDEFANEQNLTLSIFNLQGQLIQQQPLKMHEGKIKVNLSAEAKGVYNVTLSNGAKLYYGKIIFE